MILKNLNPTKNYFNKKEIIRIINTFENIVKQEVLKKDSQYTIVIENKNTKYRVANTKIILEDMLIKPLAKEIKKAMNLEEQKQTYKLPIMGQDNELYEFEIPKSKLNCPINLQRTAKQIINEIHDATKEGKKDLPIYKVHTKTNSFFGVNLELMIKRKFGYKLHDAITEYMESKYGYLAHSEYFNFEIQCYSNLNYILKPDIFTSTGNEMISKLIGVEEKKKEKKRKKQPYKEKNIDVIFEDEEDKLIQNITKIAVDKIIAETKRQIKGQKNKYTKKEQEKGINITRFSWGKYMREQIIRPLEEELASWIKGFYFPKEGVYTNSVNTNIIIPTKKEKSVIQEDLMLKLAQAINERSIMNFEKIPAGIDLRIANEYSSAFFGYTTKNKENQPKTFISIKPMLHEFLEQIYTQIKKQIPYEKITYRTNKKELITNQPYKEDCEKIIWKTNN